MGKGKLTILLKSRIFDSQNTFAVNGTLSGMEASELNPYFGEKRFHIHHIGENKCHEFQFFGKQYESNRQFKLLYEGLKFEIHK
jgi:hypothetical protein